MDRSKLVAILGSAVVLALALTVYVVIQQRSFSPPSSASMLSEEQKAYLPDIVVSDARMSAAQNFVGDTVTYLHARVTNKGAKPVRRLDIQLEFHDSLNQVVLREKVHPISNRTLPLEPGQSRPFQVTLEHMPTDWNRAPPTITMTDVHF